jgi:hypothetical protein
MLAKAVTDIAKEQQQWFLNVMAILNSIIAKHFSDED